MYRLLTARITNPALDQRLAWVVGYLFLVVCTTLILKMLPELGLPVSTLLVLCASAGWLVIGRHARHLG